MASSSQILQRGAPWAQGRQWTPAAASEASNVRVFGRQGLSAPGVLGTSPLPQIGTLIPGTPYVYIKPRLTQDDLGGSGGSPFIPYRLPGASGIVRGAVQVSDSVHRTNPEFAFYRQNRRTPSIGMGAALSMGATFGVPYSNEQGEPHFSVA